MRILDEFRFLLPREPGFVYVMIYLKGKLYSHTAVQLCIRLIAPFDPYLSNSASLC